jgi:hypothetical protein
MPRSGCAWAASCTSCSHGCARAGVAGAEGRRARARRVHPTVMVSSDIRRRGRFAGAGPAPVVASCATGLCGRRRCVPPPSTARYGPRPSSSRWQRVSTWPGRDVT